MLILVAEAPKWTDIVTAIAATIAIPGAIAGFILLFIKDNNKQKQLDRLTNIADKIDVQNSIMQEGNKLLNDQVDILRRMQIGHNEPSEGAMKLYELEQLKLKLSLRPFLKWETGSSIANHYNIQIQNFGGKAKVTNLEIDPNDIPLKHSPLPFFIEKNKSFVIYADPPVSKFGHHPDYKLIFTYEDEIGTRYIQIAKGHGAGAQFGEPNEIPNV